MLCVLFAELVRLGKPKRLNLKAFNEIASFVKRRSKARVLRLYIVLFSYSLSNTLVFEKAHGNLLLQTPSWQYEEGKLIDIKFKEMKS